MGLCLQRGLLWVRVRVMAGMGMMRMMGMLKLRYHSMQNLQQLLLGNKQLLRIAWNIPRR